MSVQQIIDFEKRTLPVSRFELEAQEHTDDYKTLIK